MIVKLEISVETADVSGLLTDLDKVDEGAWFKCQGLYYTFSRCLSQCGAEFCSSVSPATHPAEQTM